MDAALLSQILLPFGLGLIMLALGLSLQVGHFAKLVHAPRAVGLGLGLQLVVLPLVAWGVIFALSLEPTLAAGLILISLAPGGATSNAISFLCRGDVALSIALTAITSLIVPFSLPLLLHWQFSWLGLDTSAFYLPVLPTVAMLIIVTLLPLLTGMLLRRRFQRQVHRVEPWIRRITGVVFVGLVVAMAVTNQNALPAVFSITTGAILCLCLAAMGVAFAIAKGAGLAPAQQTTLTVEVGIQNAGTAMMVAATLLGQTKLAMIALTYGVAMNLPALLMISWRRWVAGASVPASA